MSNSPNAKPAEGITFSGDASQTSPSRRMAGPAGTPSNTPATSLFSKSSAEGTAPKAFDLAADEDINARLARLEVAGGAAPAGSSDAPIEIVTKLGGSKKAESKAQDDDDDDEDDDEDDDDEDDDDDDENVEYEDNFEYTADAAERAAVKDALEENQGELSALLRAHEKELYELEKKYVGLMAPHIAARAQKAKEVPGFWVDTLLRNWVLAQFIEEHDMPVLMHLNNVTYDLFDAVDEDGDVEYGMELKFSFDENEFFTNSVLSKRVTVVGLFRRDYTPGISKSEGTVIDWKKGKNVTVTTTTVKGKPGRNSKPKTKTTARPSFFNLFDTRKEFDESDDVTPETMELLNAMWNMDMAVGSLIRNKIVPNAYAWYTGDEVETEDDEDDDYEDEGDEDEDDDEDDEEEDDDEDSDDDEPPAKKGTIKGNPKKSNAKANSDSNNAEEKPECKQS